LPDPLVASRASGQLPAGRRLRNGLRAGARLALALALTYLGLLAVTFFIGRVIPVDPVLAIVGDHAPEHVIARVREEMGLNKPLYVQFGIYLQHANFPSCSCYPIGSLVIAFKSCDVVTLCRNVF
jgi:peptide/nickel transport system permease protein